MRFLFLLMFPLLLAGCIETYSWHQRIQAEVSTPSGPVSASVVQGMKVNYYPYGLFATATETEGKLTGEALVVDLGAELGPRRYLFALLPGPGLARSVFSDLVEYGTDTGRNLALIVNHKDKPPKSFEGLRWVGFADFSDPKSVFAVDPKNLSASYGKGYALTSLTLQITDDPLTSGEVETVLGWWPNRRHGPYNEMKYLQLSDDSPRGWEELGASKFWSLDLRKQFNEPSDGK